MKEYTENMKKVRFHSTTNFDTKIKYAEGKKNNDIYMFDTKINFVVAQTGASRIIATSVLEYYDYDVANAIMCIEQKYI